MRLQNRLGAAILAMALLGAAAMPAAAQKSADTLRIVIRDALPNIDPYYNNQRTGVVMHHQGWDMLVYRDPETFEIKPLLATDWKLAGRNTIDFTLRPGREVPRRQHVHRRRRRLHHQPGGRSRRARCRRRRTTPGSTRPRRPATGRCASR